MARFGLLLLACLAIPGIGFASDGVFEINQDCATSPAGCFPGDGGGFPVTIANPGSYRLTGPLEVSSAAENAILINASDVSVDLGGFRVRGPNRCSGDPTTCSLSGVGDGISVDDPLLRKRVEVRNGSVVGMGDDGVALGNDCVVSNVRAASNGGTGIDARIGSKLVGNVASTNGAYGIDCAWGCVIESNVSRENATRGIDGEGVIRGNAARDNGTFGILAGSGSTVVDNMSIQNGDHGFLINSNSLVSRNVARENGGDGIHSNGTGGGLLVQGNVANGNSGFGLALAASDSFLQNMIKGNGDGTVSGGVSRSENYCDGALAPNCP